MERFLQDPKISQVLTPVGDTKKSWRGVLKQFRKGQRGVTRQSVGEEAIKAVQRMLIFLGYSTSSTGAFAIDGDFGRGTNRAVAQFELAIPRGKTTGNRKLNKKLEALFAQDLSSTF